MKIGFVGLGQMGLPMALHLSHADHDVVGFDSAESVRRSASEAGLPIAQDLKELGRHSEAVFLSLPNASVVDLVLFGEAGLLEQADKAIQSVVDLSTIGIEPARRLSAKVESRGVRWIEAPVSGGPPAAREARLAVMLACPEDARGAFETLLGCIGRPIWVGERPGLAQAAKLANNMLSTIAMIATSEVMVMGVREGLDPDTLLEIINAGSGRNSATVEKFPKQVLTRKFAYGFQTALALKDAGLCLDAATEAGLPMYLTSQAMLILEATAQQIGPGSDFSEIAKLYEKLSGVTVESHSNPRRQST